MKKCDELRERLAQLVERKHPVYHPKHPEKSYRLIHSFEHRPRPRIDRIDARTISNCAAQCLAHLFGGSERLPCLISERQSDENGGFSTGRARLCIK